MKVGGNRPQGDNPLPFCIEMPTRETPFMYVIIVAYDIKEVKKLYIFQVNLHWEADPVSLSH